MVPVKGGRSMIIDVHAHISSPKVMDILTDHPVLGTFIKKNDAGGYILGPRPMEPMVYDLEPRLDSLKARGVDIQVIGPFNPVLNWTGGAPDVEFARFINADIADIAAQSDGLLWGAATIAFGEPDRAADELRRTLGEYGFKSIHVGISAGERTLDDPVFEPVWAVAEELGQFIFMHPAFDQHFRRCEDYELETVITYPTETSIAVSRMIFAGIFERHPGLMLCLAHGGGTLAWLGARLDRAFWAPQYERNETQHEHLKRWPSECIQQQLYLDTCVFGTHQLDFLLDFVGPERIMFGTDFPFEIADSEGERALSWLDQQQADVCAKILGDNAWAILDAARSD